MSFPEYRAYKIKLLIVFKNNLKFTKRAVSEEKQEKYKEVH